MSVEELEDQKMNLPAPVVEQSALSVHLLQSVPEEDVWLAGQLSPHTRRAYKQDVAHFVATMGIKSAQELKQVGRAAVVAWQNATRRSMQVAKDVCRHEIIARFGAR
jgi:site-specific recombinase XerD